MFGKKSKRPDTFYKSFLIMLILMVIFTSVSFSQSGSPISISYETYPVSKLANPDEEPINGQRNFTQDLGIKVRSFQFSIAYPVVISKDKTLLLNQINYQRMNIDYDNWDYVNGGNGTVDRAIGISYSAIILHKYSEKWSFMGMITPGIASDFRSDKITGDDFYFSAVAVFIKKYSEKTSVGYGLAYVPDFGQPIPVPVVAIRWNNGKNMKAECILPVNIDFQYAYSKNITFGMQLGVEGNQYHGNSEQFLVPNPQLRYSVGTFGPYLKYRLYKMLMLKAKTGFTVLRRFEFYNGNDLHGSYDLKNSGFFNIGLELDLEPPK